MVLKGVETPMHFNMCRILFSDKVAYFMLPCTDMSYTQLLFKRLCGGGTPAVATGNWHHALVSAQNRL